MDLFELEAVLRLNTQQYNRQIDEAESTGTSFVQRVGDAWVRAKSAYQTASRILQPAIDLIEQSVDSYARYQQAQGGVARVFGDSMQTVLDHAQEAYRTAGISMNDYMERVTSFGSVLMRSLGDDTAEAAELANQAIIQMSDNVNTFGTDFDTVYAAYSSLSRGIYTTLDNLNLGYAGTREGLEELIADAEELSGQTFDADNFADIVRAIGIIQQQRGISGATAAEADSTVTGSLNSLKASWDNLQTVLANPRMTPEERQGYIEAFNTSLSAFLRNITPIIRTAVRALIDVVVELLPALITDLMELIPSFVELIVGILTDTTLLGNILKLLSFAIVSALAGVIDVIATLIFGSDSEGRSAFTRWGVYDWINEAFGFSNGEQRYEVNRFNGNLGEGEGPRLPNGAPAPNTPNNPTYSSTSGNVVTDQAERNAIMAALMDMYGFSGNYSARELFGAREGQIEDVFEQLGLSEDALGSDLSALYDMMNYVNTLADAGDMEAAARQMHLVREAIHILNEGGDLDSDEADAGILANLLDETQYAEIIANIRGIDEAIDEATRARMVEIGFNMDGFTGEGEDDGSFATGLWDVPYDDYIARLHRDEMVLNATEARRYRNGEGGGSAAIVAAIEGMRNDIANLKLYVGPRAFGGAVVDYSGRQMAGYIGQAEDAAVAGYGWG